MTRCPTLLAVLSISALAAGQEKPRQGEENGPAAMKPYAATVSGTDVEIPMVPIPVGTEGYPATARIGSPDDEAGHREDEGPMFRVKVEPFWIGKYEITWDTFDAFRREYAAHTDASLRHDDTPGSEWADAVSLPTPLYEQDAAPILAGMGTKGGFPVANVTQLAARQFTKWLSKKTGHFYRLPTEAEWEYAARAGTTTAWSFGDDAEQLGEHAVYFDNSAYDEFTKGHPDFGAGYRKVGSKKPNPWGLHDVHGNVAEWVIDRHASYSRLEGDELGFMDAVAWPTGVFPCVARGGSWDSEAGACRSAARLPSDPKWQDRDPQFPKSVWWFTDGFHVGFRIVRPLEEPDQATKLRFWEPVDATTLEILRAGGKQVRAKVEEAGGR